MEPTLSRQNAGAQASNPAKSAASAVNLLSWLARAGDAVQDIAVKRDGLVITTLLQVKIGPSVSTPLGVAR
jgi:hypothetical protein